MEILNYFLFGYLVIFLISLPIIVFTLWKKDNNLRFKKIPKILWKKFSIFFYYLLGFITAKLIISNHTTLLNFITE